MYIGGKEKWKHKSMRTPHVQGRSTQIKTPVFGMMERSTFTNSIEGFWSHFRRMISGCYHDVSDEHLQHYIDEAVYRWNTRKASQSERFSDMFVKSIGLVRRWDEIRAGLEEVA